MEAYSHERFVREFVDLMDEQRAALFCGAGTSIPVGMKDWRSMLRRIADNLDLNVEFIADLVELAQFNFNERGTRNELHELIVNEYGRLAKQGPLHEHLVRLPIDTIWTTNYDKVLEHAYQQNGMRPDVKTTAGSLAAHPRLWDVQIFKMHGDVDAPDNAVLTKSDYDEYPLTRRGRAFLAALEVAMMSKTFLFLGFSLTDPNVDRILSRLSVTLKQGQRTHYCILKRPISSTDERDQSKIKHDYRLTELRIRDWRHRFAIETVLVDDYDDIPELMLRLARESRRNYVFVSGAAQDYKPLGEERLVGLARLLGMCLAREEKFLISGFGIGVGQDVVQGFFDEAYAHNARDLTDHAVLRPFPQRHIGDESDRAGRYTRYRRDMIRQAGFVVYIAGNKLQGDAVIPSSGVCEEFEIAREFGAIPIPIGMTGSVAQDLWRQVSAKSADFYGRSEVREELTTLGNSEATDKEIIDAVFSIMRKAVNGVGPP